MSKNIVSVEDVKRLNDGVRQNWIGSVRLIYTFYHDYTKASLEDVFTSRVNDETGEPFKVTEGANKFTVVTKLSLMEEVKPGRWKVSNAQASRYSAVCKWLDAKNVQTANVAKALADVKLVDITTKSSPGNSKDAAFKALVDAGLVVIEKMMTKVQINQDKVNVAGLDFDPGLNLAVVKCDDNGNVIGMVKATGNAKYNEIPEKIAAKYGKDAEPTDEDGTDVMDEAVAA